ncbi:archease [Patescibacteria group bacterium]|nr:archease [Patescibacteria group bacterium]MBU4512198.1 archease [Patescibacteria group bacterium]MCG2693453.1 archease [Candidatus Parcubacteria bacterium]
MNNDTKKFEVLEHPADLKIRAWGKDLKEVFTNMALGMMQSIKSNAQGAARTEHEVKISSINRESLLIDFLSELLYLVEINREVYSKIEITQLSEKYLQAKLYGVKARGFDLEIKAVTYGGEEVRRGGGGWEAVVIFDI